MIIFNQTFAKSLKQTKLRGKSAMLTYQFQNMKNLWFYLLEGDDIPGKIHILKRKSLRCQDYELDLQIIGSSHIISLRTASTQLTECLACLPTRDTKVGMLMESPLPLNGSEFTTTVGDIQHMIKFHTAWLGQDEYQKHHHILLKSTNKALRYEFPFRQGIVNLNPLTVLKYSCHEKLVQIWTYHTYPDERGIAETYTKIEILKLK